MIYEVAQTGEFEAFLANLKDANARRAIGARIVRFEAGLFGDTKPLGGKVSEARVDVGPGYRLYYTRKGRALVILLCGGDKSRQQSDIEKAKALVAGLAE